MEIDEFSGQLPYLPSDPNMISVLPVGAQPQSPNASHRVLSHSLHRSHDNPWGVQFPTLLFRLNSHGFYRLYRHNSIIRNMKCSQNLLTRSEAGRFLILSTARLMTAMRISGYKILVDIERMHL